MSSTEKKRYGDNSPVLELKLLHLLGFWREHEAALELVERAFFYSTTTRHRLSAACSIEPCEAVLEIELDETLSQDEFEAQTYDVCSVDSVYEAVLGLGKGSVRFHALNTGQNMQLVTGLVSAFTP